MLCSSSVILPSCTFHTENVLDILAKLDSDKLGCCATAVIFNFLAKNDLPLQLIMNH